MKKKRHLRVDHLVTVLIMLVWFVYILFILISSALYKPVQEVKEYIDPPHILDFYNPFPEKASEAEFEEMVQNVYLNESKKVYLGTFKLSGYCACSKCCGKNSNGITASGTYATAGRTIAVDTSIIPLGSKVEIGGIIYTAEDTGSGIKGKKIDIFCNSHSECFEDKYNGYSEVYLIET